MVGTRTFAEALPDSYSSDPEFEPARSRSVATGAPLRTTLTLLFWRHPDYWIFVHFPSIIPSIWPFFPN